ncbi:MAG: hypothetical protein KJI69_03785 [Patescibacteria group bacterium]|nr:hypothetical protein [Patescibacteria group bacterium]
MKGFTDKRGKFHPIRNKRYSKTRKSLVPKLELRLPKREESFGMIKKDINRDVALKEKLTDRNEAIADKIESSPDSAFAVSRRDQIKQNNQVIKALRNDLKKDLRKLTKEERRTLPDEVKNEIRFL